MPQPPPQMVAVPRNFPQGGMTMPSLPPGHPSHGHQSNIFHHMSVAAAQPFVGGTLPQAHQAPPISQFQAPPQHHVVPNFVKVLKSEECLPGTGPLQIKQIKSEHNNRGELLQAKNS